MMRIYFPSAAVLAMAVLFPPSARSEATSSKETTLYGRHSQTINQHITAAVKKEAVYIDLEGSDQIVAYVPSPLPCAGRIELTGKMIEVRGPEQHPGQKTKVDDSYVERQMDVSRWRCLEAPIGGIIDQLADPKLPPEKKSGLKREIVKKGKEAIPVLIDHLDDRRVVRREDIQNYYNLPATQPAPKPILANVSVGDECKAMLYDIITPRSASPSADLRGKPFSFSILSVPDWKAWWAKNKEKSLEQIHTELKPLVDRYWEQHGTEQMVP